MRFDDRLTTVLAQAADGPHERTVRWRQLVDLLARGGGDASGPLIDAAVATLRQDRDDVAEMMRAAAARSVAGLDLPEALIALFATDTLVVAAPVLAAAHLSSSALARLRESATPAVAAFLDSVHGGPPRIGASDVAPDPVIQTRPARPEQDPLPPGSMPSIREAMERIENLIEARDEPAFSAPPSPQPDPVGEAPSLFRWECGPGGDIGWVDGVPRGAMIGRSIAEGLATRRAFAQRAPFRDAELKLDESGVVDGRWWLSGMPAFTAGDGRFIGYRGIALREGADRPSAPAATETHEPSGPLAAARDTDSLREMVHEIKTPLNAIIGFAEIIDGQYLGPAHSRYRERAAEIVRQARTLLSAVDDLDFAAKLQSSRAAASDGTDFHQFFPRISTELNQYAAARDVGISYRLPAERKRCALDPDLCERLLLRFVESIIDACRPGELLTVELSSQSGMCALSVSRPAAIEGATRDELLNPAYGTGGQDQLGLGFALRLVRGLVRIASGDLRIASDRLVLLIPSSPA